MCHRDMDVGWDTERIKFRWIVLFMQYVAPTESLL